MRIIITHEGLIYHAYCVEHPECVGEGNTVLECLNAIGRELKAHIESNYESFIND